MKYVFLLALFLGACSTTPPDPERFCGKPTVRKVYRSTVGGYSKEETEIYITCPVASW